MRIRLGVDPNIDMNTMGAAIDAALEATTISQVPLIARGAVPDIRDVIDQGRIRWRPEPPGDEHFDDARTVLKRGWGDCDDLAPWHAAGLRASGEDPGAQAMVYRSAPRRWHAVVQRSDGSIDDPSRWAGMGQNNVVGVASPAWPPMWDQRLALAAYPFQGGWAGRVDVPDMNWPLTWSALSMAPTPAQAIVGAIRGACAVSDGGGFPSDLDIMRLHGIDALLCGTDVAVVGDSYGVGFLPAILPAAMSLASPLLSSMGMGGQPPPAPAPAAAAPSGGGGFGGGHGGGSFGCPGGPIIIRF